MKNSNAVIVHDFKQKTETKTKKRSKKPVEQLPGFKQHMEGLNYKNVAYQEKNTVIDEDGVVLQQEHKEVRKAKDDNFIKLYLSDIGYMHQLQPNQQELLFYFLKKMTYDNLIIINKTIKEMIAKESGKSFSTVENALTRYVDAGILIRQGRGVYVANPYLFGKGRIDQIQKIRMEIVYTDEGIKLRSQIEHSDEE